MHHVARPPVFIIQDLAIPSENAHNFLEFVDQDLKIYPLWLCPILGGSKALLHTAKGYLPLPSTELDSTKPQTPTLNIMNIGLWGIPNLGIVGYNPDNYHEFIAFNHAIEAKVRELKGLKWLYAHNYYTEEEFWEAYDKGGYDELRKKWHAERLPSIWDKVKREPKKEEGEVEVLGLRKAVKAFLGVVLGRDYMLATKK